MKRVRLNELDKTVRAFLDQVKGGESIMVEDENGQLQCGITPYFRASREEREQAWRDIEALQDKVAQSMKEKGITEEDVDKLLQEDE